MTMIGDPIHFVELVQKF